MPGEIKRNGIKIRFFLQKFIVSDKILPDAPAGIDKTANSGYTISGAVCPNFFVKGQSYEYMAQYQSEAHQCGGLRGCH